MDLQKHSELLKQMRFQFVCKAINCHAIVWSQAEESSKFVGPNNEVTLRSRPETLSTDGWANRMAQFHQVFRRSTNQAVTDHKGDPSSDWKPVELVADGSWYVAELGDVQDQPSSTRTEACREDRNETRTGDRYSDQPDS